MMELQSVVHHFKRLFNDLNQSRNDYRENVKKMSEAEAKQVESKRLDDYRTMCAAGLAYSIWKDAYTLAKKLQGISPAAAGVVMAFFVFAFISVVLGITASSADRSAPHAITVATNGGLLSMLLVITVVHLEFMEFIPMALVVTSFILSSAVFIIYWYFSARNMQILFIIFKGICKIAYMIYCLFMTFLRYLLVKLLDFLQWATSRQDYHDDLIPLREMLNGGNDFSDEWLWRQLNPDFDL